MLLFKHSLKAFLFVSEKYRKQTKREKERNIKKSLIINQGRGVYNNALVYINMFA